MTKIISPAKVPAQVAFGKHSRLVEEFAGVERDCPDCFDTRNEGQQPMVEHPNYAISKPGDPNADRCKCGGILYWHATVEGGGCEDCDCPEFTGAFDGGDAA